MAEATWLVNVHDNNINAPSNSQHTRNCYFTIIIIIMVIIINN